MLNVNNSIQSAKTKPLTLQSQNDQPRHLTDKGFDNILKNAIEHINKVDQEANIKTEKLATGHIEDLHDVMVTAQKASITIEAAVQVQQKAIDAYNEMMRMQV